MPLSQPPLGLYNLSQFWRGRCDRDCMVVGFTTISSINAYHYLCCEFECYSCQGVINTTLYDKVCLWLARGRWFSPVTMGPSLSWSYGSWMYNYLCNQCLSPLPDVVSSNLDQGDMYNIMIKFASDLRQVCGFLRSLRFPLPIKLTATIYLWLCLLLLISGLGILNIA